MKKQQSGFTLIELVMVIVILGILGAVAFPKFANLTGDARRASIQGALGSVKSAAAITHASALVANLTSGAQTVTLEGTAITLIDGYPTADAAGISAAAQLSDFTVAAGSAAAGASVQIDLTPAQANCFITYTAANGTASADASATVTGC